MSSPADHKFIFVCGLHRSGTSPLFRILRDHPQVSGFANTGVPEDEGQHLQTVFPSALKYGGPGHFGFSPEVRLTEESELITAENRARLWTEWSKYWDLGRPYLLEKSPPNLLRTRFLQAIFPNSYFIVVTRHPIAVSLATRKWARSSLSSLIEHWLHCHALFERDRPFLRKALVVKYEDLIESTEVEFSRISEFLGLAPSSCAGLNRDGNERYVTVWRNLAETKAWNKVYFRIVAQYESQVQRFGYSLKSVGKLQLL
jgi:hypothetical protein